MNQLTHEEARRLIQLNADQELDLESRQLLDAHVSQCSDCQAYVRELIELGNILGRVTHRMWDKFPAPLSIPSLTYQIREKQSKARINIVTTRTAVLVLALVAVLLVTRQFSQMPLTPIPLNLTKPQPIPTPSTQLTNASLAFQGCESALYEARENETLEIIALQFGVSKIDIMVFNSMKTDVILTGQELIIPLCKSTPTGTINTPTITITITPQFHSITTTPG